MSELSQEITEKKDNKPKLTNCTPQDIMKTLKKLGGFFVVESKHYIIKHITTGKKSTIPRKKPINRNLLKDFIEDYLVKELNYKEKEIYKYLWC